MGFKAFNQLLPEPLQSKFTMVKDVQKYNIRSNFKFHYVKKDLNNTSIILKAKRMFNDIPDNLKYCSSIKKFKHELKMFFINK
jgi:hypothetical protein